jgi:radical SAM superfamily enzyme YgiQ (UPF0313 family)
MGLENDDEQDLIHRAKFIMESSVDAIQTTLMTPLPGTVLFNRLKNEGRLMYTNFPEDWSRYHFGELVHQPLKMSHEAMNECIQQQFVRMYDPKTLKRRMIQSLKNTRNPVTATWAYASNLQYRNIFFEDTERLTIEDLFKAL